MALLYSQTRRHMINLFTKCVTKSCDLPDWLIQSCYQSASSRVTEALPCAKCFQRYFSEENIIILFLNIVNLNTFYGLAIKENIQCLHRRIIYSHIPLAIFQRKCFG